MHHDVKYDINDPADHARAIADVEKFMAPKQWKAISELSTMPSISEESLQMYASIAGVSGFPIRALWLANNPTANQIDPTND